MAALKAENIQLGYSHRGKYATVLQDISFEAKAGDLAGVAGLNGSGKSTLLRAIAGLIQPISGDLFLNGQNSALMSVSDRAREVAVVLTGKISGFNVNVADAVSMGLMPYTDAFHRLTNQQREFLSAVLEKTGLTGYGNRELAELSDGLYQKTMIAKALAQQTPVLLLDEPLAFLDYGSKHEFLRLLADLCTNEKKCVLISTHDLDLLKRYCNKTIIVANNTARLYDTAEASQHPEFLQMGGGYLK